LAARDEAIAQRDAQIASLQKQLATAPTLSDSDRATLRKLAAGELRRLQKELEVSEQDLLNQDKGRRATTDEGLAKKEQRKAELALSIAKLQQAIAQLQEIGQKLTV
jgi:hypothetical protein